MVTYGHIWSRMATYGHFQTWTGLAPPTGERVNAGENPAVHLSFTRSPGPFTVGDRPDPIRPRTAGEKVNGLSLLYT